MSVRDEDAIPVVLCFDVEPDESDVDRPARPRWRGFEATVAWARELRDQLAEATGGPVRFAWFLRMDPQIATAYGRPTWVAETYGRVLDELRAAGDGIGVHPHAWRWQDPPGRWCADHADTAWVEHCMDVSFSAYREAFGVACLLHRFGDRFLDATVLRRLRAHAVRVDVTVEPGARPIRSLHPDMAATGRLPDYARAPRTPYRAERDDPLRPSDDPAAPGPWFLPLTAADPAPAKPRWWRFARRLRHPGRPGHRPVLLWSDWPAASFWRIIGRELAASPRPHLAFAIRSDAAIRPQLATPIGAKLGALGSQQLGRRLRFTDPESAATRWAAGWTA